MDTRHRLEYRIPLRIAALLYRRRADMQLPAIQARRQGRKFRVTLDAEWLARNPLTVTALHDEIREWARIDFEVKIPELDEIERGSYRKARGAVPLDDDVPPPEETLRILRDAS